MVEGIAPYLALRTYRRYLQGRAGYVFSDNISAESILVKGYTPKADDLNGAANEFWLEARALEMSMTLRWCSGYAQSVFCTHHFSRTLHPCELRV